VPEENWLPLNRADMDLDIIMRLYAPDHAALCTRPGALRALDGAYRPEAELRRVGEQAIQAVILAPPPGSDSRINLTRRSEP